MTLTHEPAPHELPGPYTVADLAGMPDDGRRYELIDGALIVTPAPILLHQAVLARTYRHFLPHEAADLLTMFAPVDYEIDEHSLLQPDLLVLRRADLSRKTFEGTPVLVLEVLSPSTRKYDRFTKLAAYAEAGVPHYWIVDPLEPSVSVHELDGDGYRRTHHVVGADLLTVTEPFRIELRPADLIADVPDDEPDPVPAAPTAGSPNDA